MSFRNIPRIPKYNTFNNGRRANTNPRLWAWGIGAFASSTYVIAHLERSETGRWRYIDVTPQSELRAGQDAYRSIIHQYRNYILPPSHPTTVYVRGIAEKLINASPSFQNRNFDWEVYVIRSPTKNAMVLPGGKIFVFEGILPVCNNQNGLAAVLGHETAHQYLKHSAERMSYMKIFFILSLALQTLGIDFGLSQSLIKVVLDLPNSRRSEYEADKIGMEIAARACFDPSEAIRVWQRMSKSDSGTNFDFLSTHPNHSNRIEHLREFLPNAQRIFDLSECQTFQRFKQTMMPNSWSKYTY